MPLCLLINFSSCGGFIAQTGAGIYDFMPLGKIVLEKLELL